MGTLIADPRWPGEERFRATVRGWIELLRQAGDAANSGVAYAVDPALWQDLVFITGGCSTHSPTALLRRFSRTELQPFGPGYIDDQGASPA